MPTKATADAIKDRSATTVNLDIVEIGGGDSVLLMLGVNDSSGACSLLLKVEIFDRYCLLRNVWLH